MTANEVTGLFPNQTEPTVVLFCKIVTTRPSSVSQVPVRLGHKKQGEA